MSSVNYDSHGNTLGYIAGGTTTSLGWDGADRNVSARVTGADPTEVTYTRDATDRIVRRDTTATVIYTYTGTGDTSDIALRADLRIATRSISLPGGVLYTVGGDGTTQPTFDHPTIRGDLCLTTNTTGHQPGPLRTYTPYGEPLTTTGTINSDAVPDNQPGQMDHGWLGQHQRPHEHAGTLSLIQMGARPYSQLLGRFLSVDPIESGSANDYDYVARDPINSTDLDGKARCSWLPWNWGNCAAAATISAGRAVWHGASWAARKVFHGLMSAAKWVGNSLRGGARWVGRIVRQWMSSFAARMASTGGNLRYSAHARRQMVTRGI